MAKVIDFTPKQNRIKQGSVLVDVIIYTFIGIVALVTLYPFILIFSNSISNPVECAANTVWLYPKGFSLKAYGQILNSDSILRSFLNSVGYTVLITFLSVLNAVFAGYALSVKGLFARKYIVLFIMIPMFFNAGLIPTFIIISRYGMFNTLWAIILPSIVSIWNIILARTYISGLPAGLKEAAIIDGANDFDVIFKIVIPLSKPIIAVLALYTALGVWNQWFNFLVYVPSLEDWHPLQMYLTKTLIWGNMSNVLKMEGNIDPELIKNKLLMAAVGSQLKYAVIMVASIPVIMIYPFVQKYFIQGALLGSLKE
ncbi:MAG: carbohydrate ABC transporter permease [Ruminococcaceae bacterium]|nr:carbohydrate ABC transporter permease [Oscillospiraceae bacterium]